MRIFSRENTLLFIIITINSYY